MLFQLRVYDVEPGRLDDWVREWRAHVLPLRRAHGFAVVGPWIVRGADRFVWILGHDDFERADAAYYSSPERRALEPDPARHLARIEQWLMDALPPSDDEVHQQAEADQHRPDQE